MASQQQELSEGLGVLCPGCEVSLTVFNIGGYRTYCQKCVDAMPPLPNGNCGYILTGEYPDFKWKEIR